MGASSQNSDAAFGVYVHWPFCAQKCPYCDFNSHVRFGGWDETRFLQAYLRELDWVADRIGQRRVSSVFFGGGTPSLMQPQTTAAILDHVAKRWSISPDVEITFEANPGSVEAARFRGYRDAGVNRVSVGVQSLRDEELRKLGRIHSAAEAIAAIDIARATFERFSFDMIYARPGQTLDDWQAELAEALAISGEHLSLYQLTIEPETPYAALHKAGKLVVPDDDMARELYEATGELTAARGLDAYEVSNYARPGTESRHNLLYWRYGEYAGIGPGAHGRIVIDGKRHATVAERNPEAWAARVETQGHGFTENATLSRVEQAEEALLMGLRLGEGIDLGWLTHLGGIALAPEAIVDLEDLGLIQTLANANRPPPENWRANELAEIVACAGPGLPPSIGTKQAPRRLRVTPAGRLVLNAVVAKLAGAFVPVAHMDKVLEAH